MIARIAKALTALLFLVAISSTLLAEEQAAGPSEEGQTHAQGKDWLKLYYLTDGIRRIEGHPTAEIDSIYYTRHPDADSGEDRLQINISASGSGLFSLPVDSIEDIVLGSNIPTLYIDTDPYVKEIPDKETYLQASLRYIPYGDGTDTLVNAVQIKGRGNTSWAYRKKPYRLKFDKKQALAGLNKAKSFVLVSNYIDNTLMKNTIAYKIAEMLELPFSPSPVPVNLVFNGMQRGSYILMNKVGINAGSVDIDEKEGILWELDTYYDEEFRFTSSVFSLPCMVKDPDFHEIAGDDPDLVEEIWQGWQEDLEEALRAVNRGEWEEAFDADQMVKYVLVNSLMQNRELKFPKSMYIYKEKKGEKYKAGPVWDFDWGLNYATDEYVQLVASYSKPDSGRAFFLKIFKTASFMEKMAAEIENFCDNHLEMLMEFIDSYADTIADSAMLDAMLWPQEHQSSQEIAERNTARFRENVEYLKEFILGRIDYILNDTNYGLY